MSNGKNASNKYTTADGSGLNMNIGELVLLSVRVPPTSDTPRRDESRFAYLGVFGGNLARQFDGQGVILNDVFILKGSRQFRGVDVVLQEAHRQNPLKYRRLGKAEDIVAGKDRIVEYLRSDGDYAVHADWVERLDDRQPVSGS